MRLFPTTVLATVAIVASIGFADSAAASASTTAAGVVTPSTVHSAPVSSLAEPREVGGFITNADLPHQSGSDISVHGWWEKTPVAATKATKAKVTVWLQAKPYGSNAWTRVGSGSGTYGPGPGRGNRATGRVTCGVGPTAPVSFRAEVDVDLIGYQDSPEHAYGKVATFSCLYR